MTAKLNLNPRTVSHEEKRIRAAVAEQNYEKGVWLRSSGTESGAKGIKLVFLSQSAMQVAAMATNKFLQLDEKDVWLNPLPKFHVGGLMVEIRCSLIGATEVEMQGWDPKNLVDSINDCRGSLTSLVPTQVYDLVEKGISCPSTLRAVLVGGGALEAKLYKKARQLGWPLLPSYGMTETAAMVACAPLSSLESNEVPAMNLLDHVQLKQHQDKWEIESQSLFTGYLWVREGSWDWQERPTPFLIDDNLVFNDSKLEVLGRSSELVKILGETVSLLVLEQRFLNQLGAPVSVVAKPVDRLGYELHLFVEKMENTISIEDINRDLMPFERIAEIHRVENFPRTDLGKVLKNQLLAMT